MTEKDIKSMMALLKCNREEAIQVIKDDEAIEKGEKLFELTAEQKKNVKKMTNTTSANKKTTKTPRKRAENEDKRYIIDQIYSKLIGIGLSCQKINVEREISFDFNGKNYSVTLIQHRK